MLRSCFTPLFLSLSLSFALQIIFRNIWRRSFLVFAASLNGTHYAKQKQFFIQVLNCNSFLERKQQKKISNTRKTFHTSLKKERERKKIIDIFFTFIQMFSFSFNKTGSILQWQCLPYLLAWQSDYLVEQFSLSGCICVGIFGVSR